MTVTQAVDRPLSARDPRLAPWRAFLIAHARVVRRLVERSACLADARGAEAVLTERGLARLRAASRTHLRGINEHFLAVAASTDLEAMERGLTAVARQAGPANETTRSATEEPGLPSADDR
jgi:hypothetical protein